MAGAPSPFVLPWDDSTPGVTDASHLNRPIDADARVTVDPSGHFRVRGQRVRFLGMNFATDSPFMPTNRADAVAARLARFGVNAVRFHHLDPPWATGGGLLAYTPRSSRDFNPAQLERIHFLVSRLSAHGIYANFNLLTAREFRPDDGLGPEITQVDWKDQHVLAMFDPRALELQKEFASKLLAPVNPFRGKSLAADPAVAFIEILNENGLLQKWYEGNLDRLPEVYSSRLTARRNDWLREKHGTHAALLKAWGMSDPRAIDEQGRMPTGASLDAATIPCVRRRRPGFTGSEHARRDWIRFAIDLETAYYDALREHLRGQLGYAGILFGTIMANSPAAVQSRLDVIDGHAYWDHPQFPGGSWDMSNWRIRNRSMFEAPPAETTISTLARQRIAGKPFMVTEYQHASPNAYGAEGPLILAAYASLQDWDGIWFFDYGWGNASPHGGDAEPMGRYRGFFDMAQHPAKMVNLLLAAHLFRRGDVGPAAGEHVVALAPDAELDMLLRDSSQWSVFTSRHLGVPGELSMLRRLAVRLGTDPRTSDGGPSSHAGQDLMSDTGELRWSHEERSLTIRTARTVAALGFVAGRRLALGEVEFDIGGTELGWATVGLTLAHGDSFAGGGTAVLIATGLCENTDQRWKDPEHTTLASWGRAPTVVETVPLRLTLPVERSRVRAWVLDERGARRKEADIRTDANGGAVLTTRSEDATLWYEIEIASRERD